MAGKACALALIVAAAMSTAEAQQEVPGWQPQIALVQMPLMVAPVLPMELLESQLQSDFQLNFMTGGTHPVSWGGTASVSVHWTALGTSVRRYNSTAVVFSNSGNGTDILHAHRGDVRVWNGIATFVNASDGAVYETCVNNVQCASFLLKDSRHNYGLRWPFTAAVDALLAAGFDSPDGAPYRSPTELSPFMPPPPPLPPSPPYSPGARPCHDRLSLMFLPELLLAGGGEGLLLASPLVSLRVPDLQLFLYAQLLARVVSYAMDTSHADGAYVSLRLSSGDELQVSYVAVADGETRAELAEEITPCQWRTVGLPPRTEVQYIGGSASLTSSNGSHFELCVADVHCAALLFKAPPPPPPPPPPKLPPQPPPHAPPPMICLDTCGTAGDAVCQDGGWGAYGSMCEFGADCADCGARLLIDPPPSPPRFPPPPPPAPSPPSESGQGDALADGPSSNVENSSSNVGAIAGGAGERSSRTELGPASCPLVALHSASTSRDRMPPFFAYTQAEACWLSSLRSASPSSSSARRKKSPAAGGVTMSAVTQSSTSDTKEPASAP